MREETKRRLERTLMMERAKWAAGGLAICLAMAGMFYFISRDHDVVDVRVPATVARVAPLATKQVQGGLEVDVTLADGQLVRVLVNEISHPQVGQKIEITAHRHGTGRRTYSFK
jgi:hypothetical protein